MPTRENRKITHSEFVVSFQRQQLPRFEVIPEELVVVSPYDHVVSAKFKITDCQVLDRRESVAVGEYTEHAISSQCS